MSDGVEKELLKKEALSPDVFEEARGLWQRLEKIKSSGIVLNAYSGDIYEEDYDILSNLYDFFCEHFEQLDTWWISTYMQIFSWQFQSYHEGVDTYYTNFYGASDYNTIRKTADYLRIYGYDEISKWYSLGVHDYSQYEDEKYPEEWIAEIKEIDKWIDSNEEIIFRCMIDLLLKYKEELFN